MTDPVLASAPGKLVLVGEYAVVYGAPALVAAMPRRARVSLAPRSDRRWVVATPGLSDAVHSFEHQDDPRLTDALPLLRAALDETRYDGPGQTVELNTEAFFAPARQPGETPLKLGLGSSAALCVCLVAALCENRPSQAPDSMSLALAAHRRFQGGRGSGIDVAASYSGGVVRFQRLTANDDAITVSALPLPAAGAWIWSGSSADTRSRLARLERFRAARPDAFARAMDALAKLSEAAGEAAERHQVEAFVESAAEFTARLAELDEQAGLGVWTAAHRELAALAHTFGLLYKTSGAGGGDCGIALHPDSDRLDDFRRAAADKGFPSWNLAADNGGLRVERPGSGKKPPVLR